MRIANILVAAGIAVAGLTAATSAEAQSYRDYRGYDYGYDNRYDGNWDRGRHNGWDRGRHYRWNRDRYYRSRYDRHHRRCWTEWRYDEPVTICRR